MALLPDLFSVYREADASANVLSSTRLPVDFHEESALHIVSSYHEYVKADEVDYTSIATKNDEGAYTSPYQLYHDIKAVSSALISVEAPGTTTYSDIDFFYKFSTELLLRELVRVNLRFQEESKLDRPLELEAQLLNDYNKISQTYQLDNGEVITYIYKAADINPLPTQNIYANHAHIPAPTRLMQPLFSSLLGRSNLDIKPTIVTGDFSVAKVVPFNKNIARNDSTLDSVSPSITKFPMPGDSSSLEILQDFFHPIWFTIPVPTWISYKLLRQQSTAEVDAGDDSQLRADGPDFSEAKNAPTEKVGSSAMKQLPRKSDCVFTSFAPQTDLRRSIISSLTKSRIWFDHVGANDVANIKSLFLASKKHGSALDSYQEGSVDSNTGGDHSAEIIPESISSDYANDLIANTENNVKTERTSSRKINIANLATWDPENNKVLNSLVEDQDILQKSARSLQGVISNTLLRLNKERQYRFRTTDAKALTEPSDKEKRLYFKAQRLMALLLEVYNVSPNDLDARPDPVIPVLTTEYAGVLPGIPANKLGSAIVAAAPTNKSLRLPSIRGPYKKRNRNL